MFDRFKKSSSTKKNISTNTISRFAKIKSFFVRKQSTDQPRESKTPNITKGLIWRRSQAQYKTRVQEGETKPPVARLWTRYLTWRNLAVTVVAIALAAGGIFVYTDPDRWQLKSIEFRGTQNLTEQQLSDTLAEFRGQNLFLLNPSDPSHKLKENYVEIKTARFEKIFPDKAIIYIEEKNPKLLYRNFNGIYLLDDQAEVLKYENAPNPIKYDPEDMWLARGFGDINADYVQDRLLEPLTDEQKNEFDFENLDPKIKTETLKKIIDEKKQIFDQRLTDTQNFQLSTLKDKYPEVVAWDDRSFNTGAYLDKSVVLFFDRVVSAVTKRLGFGADSVVWDGEVLLKIRSKETEIIFFYSVDGTRSVDDQIDDFVSFYNNQKSDIYKYKVIDLSSEVIVAE